MQYLIIRLWNSPTLTSLGSYVLKTMSLLLVTPLIVTKFSTSELALYYIFGTFISLQNLMDMGFSATFTRYISYALGGARDFTVLVESNNRVSTSPNWFLIAKVWSIMQTIYFRMAVIYLFLLVSTGTLLLLKPIAMIEDPLMGWASWALVVLFSAIAIFSAAYSSYLQGLNQIPSVKRIEILTSILSTFSAFIVLLNSRNLFLLVLSNQIWIILNLSLLKKEFRKTNKDHAHCFRQTEFDRTIFNGIWKNAWRSGLGVWLSTGIVQMTGLFYAQLGQTKEVTSYLFTMRFATVINFSSQVPFYSKIPLLSRLRVEGKQDQLLKIASKGMFFSLILYTTGVVILGITANPILSMIRSNVEFVQPSLWILISWAFFFERYGAMHLQLYTTSNKIIWHKITLISGSINIFIVIFTFQKFEVYSFPLGVLGSYLLYYSWYAAAHSYRDYRMRFITFEYRTTFVPLLILVTYSLWSLIY